MSYAEEEIVAALEGDAGVHAQAGDRIYPWPLPKDAVFPALTYYLVGTPTTQALDASVFERRPQFTVNVWADEPADRAATAAAVSACLLGMPGYVEMVNEGRDVPEPVTGLYRRDIDARLLR